MKKKYLLFAAATLFYVAPLWSQYLPVKLPYSFDPTHNPTIYSTVHIPPFSKEYIMDQVKNNNNNRNLVGLLQDTDISFPQSSTMTTTAEGIRVWRVKIEMPDAKGLGLYFDQFHLPEGVEMFLYNENKKQLKGTYSYKENNESRKFATDPIQGSTMYLELNIQPNVSLGDIVLHIDKAAAYLFSTEDLKQFEDNHATSIPALTSGDATLSSSTCMINANCEQSEGFEKQRQSTVMVNFRDETVLYSCTGVMINSANNEPGSSCKNYILTASSCEPNDATDEMQFLSQTIIRFNSNPVSCDNPTESTPSHAVTGVNFKARSSVTSIEDRKGDFILMEMRTPIHPSWNIFMSGYNAGEVETTVTAPDKMISFHHPDSDIKKLSTYSSISNYDAATESSHWHAIADEGYHASLGAPLFDKNGRVIGIASFSTPGFDTPEECLVNNTGIPAPQTSREMKYSKLSYNWSNPGDDGSPNRMLKTWLDPDGGTVLQTDPSTVDCTTEYTSTTVNEAIIGDINIYPNPSTSGEFHIQFMVPTEDTYTIEIFNVAGQSVFKTDPQNLGQTTRRLNLSHLNNGMYIFKLSNQHGSLTQKLLIAK